METDNTHLLLLLLLMFIKFNVNNTINWRTKKNKERQLNNIIYSHCSVL